MNTGAFLAKRPFQNILWVPNNNSQLFSYGYILSTFVGLVLSCVSLTTLCSQSLDLLQIHLVAQRIAKINTNCISQC